MSLPPGFLDELRTRTSISQVVGRKVVWDTRKSNQGKGDMWSPCPFHQEKTASFHVDDQKGFYYCFGCHAKGDALGFIKETENVSFMEAVEILAREAGMPMPARDPQAQQKADRQTQLIEVMTQALQFFKLQLKTNAGHDARQYLNGRGLGQGAIDKFDIGFAPDGWQGLWDHLISKNIAQDLILAAGLAKPSTKGGKAYDTFRNRIMFPIRDVRGRVIAFGGRAMDPNDNAKYLNSPETELFDKGRTLYNHAPAREAAGKGQPLIVAEGYMDVIALSEAGFGAAVAPLGTAVTENQLQMLWRISNEPLIALDGDTAGLRAALRVVDLSLPLLEAGKSLRFAMMPTGKDPDDVLRDGGSGAMQSLLDAAKPMVDLIWDRAVEGKDFDSPERKAALDKDLRDKLRLIKDGSIRGHYGQAIKSKRWDLFRPQSGSKSENPWGKPKIAPPAATTKSSRLTRGNTADLREAVVLASILRTPECLDQVADALEDIEFSDRTFDQMRGFFASYIGAPDVLWQATEAGFGDGVLKSLFDLPHIKIAPSVRRAGDVNFVCACLRVELKQIAAPQAHALELQDGERDIQSHADEGLTWRLAQSAQSVQHAGDGPKEDTAEYATAENGLELKQEERKALDDLLEGITFSKPKRN